MPDNETVVQMKFTVNNNEADPERVGVRDIFYYNIYVSTNSIVYREQKASKVLTNPAVMEQIMTAIGKVKNLIIQYSLVLYLLVDHIFHVCFRQLKLRTRKKPR